MATSISPRSARRRTQVAEGAAYIRLKVTPELRVLCPLAYVQEVLTLPAGRLTPMPNMPPQVLGLANCRTQILWLVDLPMILGAVPLYGLRQFSVLRVHCRGSGAASGSWASQGGSASSDRAGGGSLGGTALGLAAYQIEGITWLDVAEPVVPEVETSTLAQPEPVELESPGPIFRSPYIDQYLDPTEQPQNRSPLAVLNLPVLIQALQTQVLRAQNFPGD